MCIRMAINFLIIVFAVSIGVLGQENIWHEHTFDDFIDGSFDDSGANMYVSHQGHIQMINRWDVNGDGNIDILCANSHPLKEMLDMSIYWGNGKDFSIQNHSYIPANGPMWVTADDLNEDGDMDLVVANYSNGTWTEMDSYIYYGGLEKNHQKADDEWAFYPFKERVSLPGKNTQKAAVGDFNKDGYKDIVFAFSGGFWEYRSRDGEGLSASRIYWGSQEGFNPENFTNMPTKGATDVAVADLDNDDWLDLVFANGEGSESFIYFGGKSGFDEKRIQKLPTVKPYAVAIGDVNADYAPDIVFANESGGVSFAYINKNGRFAGDDKIEFETYTAKDAIIEDFNKDGFPDIFFTNHQHSLTGDPRLANRLIDSFLYFGSAEGFQRDKRQSLQTIGAWGANAADLNKDGWVDLLICNFQEHYSYEVPSFVYWNGPEGFQLTKRTCLYEHGAQGNAIADFNGDGYLDVLITSMMGNSRGDYDPNYLYFGDEKGNYSVDRRVSLPGRESYEQGFADLDDDGQVDILLLNRGEVTRVANELWIYWNQDNEFDPWRITGLPAYNGLGVEIADLDRNGYLDIIISNGPPAGIRANGNPDPGSFIYWGSPEGWAVTQRTELPIVWTRACAVCDMNKDGHLDIVFGQQRNWGDASIFYGNGTREFSNRVRIEGSNGSGTPGVADLNRDGRLDIAFAHDKNVLVYYQQKDGQFSKKRSASFPVQAKTMCVADVNGDNWLDLICPFYRGSGRRTWVSTILLGSKKGYSMDNILQLPTDGGTGSIVSDFNRDGYQDIFFFCHRTDGSADEIGKFGDHYTHSLIYWGSADGFNSEKRLEIPSVGVHYDVGVDIGHIKDRKFKYVYLSSPYPARGKRPVKLAFQAEMPFSSTLSFQIRTAKIQKDLVKAKWTGPGGEGTFFKEFISDITHVSECEWIQYRAVFDTDNGVYSPILQSVKIEFK